MNSVVVTGLGAVTPLGENIEKTWKAMCQGVTAARSWDDLSEFPIDVACRVTANIGKHDPLQRGAALGCHAVRQALQQACVSQTHQAGLFIGTTMGESSGFEYAAEYGIPLEIENCGGASLTEHLQSELGFNSISRTYGTACAAGNFALGSAMQAIQAGRLEMAIAGGIEPFSRIAMLGFSRMRAMSPDVCRPFDANRRGMQLGEGDAFIVLENATIAKQRGIQPLAKLSGFGASCDAYHPTAPRANGSGMAAAMSACLRFAETDNASIDWVCADGTGTRQSDTAEANALHIVFGDRIPPVGSLKGAIGHALGAATAQRRDIL